MGFGFIMDGYFSIVLFLVFSSLLRSQRCRSASGLGHSLFSEVSMLSQSCNLLRLLNLLLVGLDLALELVNQRLESLSVLAILIQSVGQFLDVSLRLAEILGGISTASVLCIKLRLKLTHTSLHLGQSLLASLEGSLFSIIQSALRVLQLDLQQLLVSLKHHCRLLLCTELLGQSGGINHGLLGLLIGHPGLHGHLLQIMVQVVHLLLALHLGTTDGLVLASQVTE